MRGASLGALCRYQRGFSSKRRKCQGRGCSREQGRAASALSEAKPWSGARLPLTRQEEDALEGKLGRDRSSVTSVFAPCPAAVAGEHAVPTDRVCLSPGSPRGALLPTPGRPGWPRRDLVRAKASSVCDMAVLLLRVFRHSEAYCGL